MGDASPLLGSSCGILGVKDPVSVVAECGSATSEADGGVVSVSISSVSVKTGSKSPSSRERLTITQVESGELIHR